MSLTLSPSAHNLAVDAPTSPNRTEETHSLPPIHYPAQPGLKDYAPYNNLDSRPDPAPLPLKLHWPGVSGHPVPPICVCATLLGVCLCSMSVYYISLIIPILCGMIRLVLAPIKLMSLVAVNDPTTLTLTPTPIAPDANNPQKTNAASRPPRSTQLTIIHSTKADIGRTLHHRTPHHPHCDGKLAIIAQHTHILISAHQAQIGGGPPKTKTRRNSKKITAMLTAAVPGLAELPTHPLGNSPDEPIWVPPADVGLFCEAQNRGYCGVHALNAMASRPAFHARAAIRLLRHPSTPPPVTGDPDCSDDGWFSMEALCKLLYFTTHIDVALIHIVQTWRQESSGAPHYTQSEILEMAPPNCDAFLVWIPGHYVCWKRSPMNGKWYCLDSIPYGTGPHKGRIRELTPADWWNLNGSLSTTVAADAYLSNTTGMPIKNSRKVLPPINRAEMNYINLTDVPTQSGPTPRPAARWIQEDFHHQRPCPISQPQEHSCKPIRPHPTPFPKPRNTSVHNCPHKPRLTGPSPKPPRPPTIQSLKRARQDPLPNKPSLPARSSKKHHSRAPKPSHIPQPLDNTTTTHHSSVRQHHSAPNTYACDAGPHTHYTNALYDEPRAHQNPLFVELDDQRATALNPAPPKPHMVPKESHVREGPQCLTTMQTDHLPPADSVCALDIDDIHAEPLGPQHPQSATQASIPLLSHTTPRHSTRPRPLPAKSSQTKPQAPALPTPTLPRPPTGIKKRCVKPTPKLPTGMKCLPLTTYFTDIEHHWKPTIRLTSQDVYRPAKRQPKLPNIRDYMYTNKPPPTNFPKQIPSHPDDVPPNPDTACRPTLGPRPDPSPLPKSDTDTRHHSLDNPDLPHPGAQDSAPQDTSGHSQRGQPPTQPSQSPSPPPSKNV